MLNKLEHHLLSTMMNGWEPLHILYRTARDDVGASALDPFLVALTNLYNNGQITVRYYYDHWEIVEKLSFDDLMKHCADRSDAELRQYPEQSGEYFFTPTPEGRLEESKEVYDAYYP